MNKELINKAVDVIIKLHNVIADVLIMKDYLLTYSLYVTNHLHVIASVTSVKTCKVICKRF